MAKKKDIKEIIIIEDNDELESKPKKTRRLREIKPLVVEALPPKKEHKTDENLHRIFHDRTSNEKHKRARMAIKSTDSRNDLNFRRIIEYMKIRKYDSKEIQAMERIYELYKYNLELRCNPIVVFKVRDALESFLNQENGDANELMLALQSAFVGTKTKLQRLASIKARKLLKPRRLMPTGTNSDYASSSSGVAVSTGVGAQMVGGYSLDDDNRDDRNKIATDGYKEAQKDEVNFTCYYDKVASTSSTVCLNFAAYEEEFKKELEDMLNKKAFRSSGKKLIEKDIEYDVILTSPDLKRFKSEQKFTWLGDYSVLYFDAKIPEHYDKEKVVFRFDVKNMDIPIASILISIDIRNNTANISETIKPKVFLSYSSYDYDKVRISEVFMESLGLCKKLFFDRKHLKQGQIWYKEAEDAIDDCDMFFLFWSYDAMESKNVKREYEYMIKKRGLDKLKLVPISKMTIDKIPTILKDVHYDNNLAAEIERLYSIIYKSKNIA